MDNSQFNQLVYFNPYDRFEKVFNTSAKNYKDIFSEKAFNLVKDQIRKEFSTSYFHTKSLEDVLNLEEELKKEIHKAYHIKENPNKVVANYLRNIPTISDTPRFWNLG